MCGWKLALARAWLLSLGLLAAACTAPELAATPPPVAVPAARVATPAPAATATPRPKEAIRAGALFDLTGPTAAISAPYRDAIRRYFTVLKTSGGLGDRRFDLVEADYAGRVPRAVDSYKRLIADEKVVAFLGWSNADTEALSPMLGGDKVPYMSASYAELLVSDLTHRPYNFLPAATYSDQMRVLLKNINDGWKEQDRRPAIALLYQDDPFGRSPISMVRDVTARLDIEIADEQIFPAGLVDATPQLYSIQRKKADFVIVHGYTPPAAVVARDAAKIGLKARLMTLSPAADEDFLERAGPAAEGVIAITPFAFLAEGKPGFEELKAAYAMTGTAPTNLSMRHVQGWLTAKLMVEGIKRAGEAPTGETIKAGLETIRDYDTGGITAHITWTKDDHVGNKFLRLYEVRNGAWQLLTDLVKAER